MYRGNLVIMQNKFVRPNSIFSKEVFGQKKIPMFEHTPYSFMFPKLEISLNGSDSESIVDRVIR